MDEWVLHTANIEYNDNSIAAWVGEAISKGLRRHQDNRGLNYRDTEVWVGEAISKDLRKHQDNRDPNYGLAAWVGEAISKGLKRYQNVRCFNCGRTEHLKSNCRKIISRNNTPRNILNRRPQPFGLCRRCGKGRHWTNECRSTSKETLYNWETPWVGGALKGPHVKSCLDIPSHSGGQSPKRRLENPVPIEKRILLWISY